jgi:putative hydrolase of the HAD superfamily
VTPVIVFDLDDTLYLERDYVLSGFQAVGEWAERQLLVSDIFEKAWNLFLAGGRRTTITEAFEQVGRPLDTDETAEAVRVYREHKPDIRLCDDAELLLDSLAGVARVAVVTDGVAVSQRAKIDVLGLSTRAHPIVVTSEHGSHWQKPGLSSFRSVQTTLHAEPTTCTYIADNPTKDFAGPKTLGWRTIRVARPLGLHSHTQAPSGIVDRTVTTLADLIRTSEQM